MSRILIVDNDAGRTQSLQRLLCTELFVPTCVEGLRGALDALGCRPFDGVLLNDSPPAMDGLVVCRCIRETSNVPIILLSRDGGLSHKVCCLESGADDFVVRPYDARELVARLRAVLRGRGEYSARRNREPIVIGDLVVDTVRHETCMLGRPLSLTHREFSIVRCLAERAGEAVPRDCLFEEVWGYDARLGGKLLEVYIRRVRCKLEPDPRRPAYLQTVRGFGYRLAEPKENAECGMMNDE